MPRGVWQAETLDVARMTVLWTGQEEGEGGGKARAVVVAVTFLLQEASRVSWYNLPHATTTITHTHQPNAHPSLSFSPLLRHTG